MAEQKEILQVANGELKSTDNPAPGIMVLKFADSKPPKEKIVNNKEYILFGEFNDYPEYLLYQYNKCGRHRAIINGKVKYIMGGGLEGTGAFVKKDGEEVKKVNGDDTMVGLLKKSCKDIEIYGGFRWFIRWDALGKIKDIIHDDFNKFRTGKTIFEKDATGKVIAKKTGGFWYKEKWFNEHGRPDNKEKPVHYEEFTGVAPENGATQVFAYNEYSPGCDAYPLPEYVASANYIDIDIEISKFHLSSLRNGMMPSKMVQFYTGDPPEDKKKDIERRWSNKFAGSENAGRFILVFNTNKDKSVDVSDLSFNELDKQFEILNKTTEQQIFTGHQIVSPMLFGVKTEGQLGGTTELRIAYEIFINTYAKPKQDDLLEIVNYFGGLMGVGSDYKFTQLDPVGIILDIKDFIEKLPSEFVLDKLGVPAEYRTPAVAQPGVTLPGQTAVAPQEQVAVNESVKNLTTKQHQQLLRIIRQYGKGQLTKEAATTLLKAGLGLSDEEVKSVLGISEEDETGMMQKFEEETEAKVLAMFAACGDLKSDFHIIKSKKLKYDADVLVEENEFYRLAFKTSITISEGEILDLISKDPKITPEVIAKTLKTTPEYVTAKIAKLVKSKILKTTKEGETIERTLTKPLSQIVPDDTELSTTEILVKYSYEGPKDDRNRPFCAKMMALDRLYTRFEIENISERLGYSVWERRGGWWTKPDGEHSPSCRHRWESHVVIKKNKK